MRITTEINKKKYIKFVLERDHITYEIIAKGEGELLLEIPDNTNVEELMEDILCEQQRDHTESKIPVYSYRTLLNKDKRDRLMKYYGKRGFHVLKGDEEKCRKDGLI